MNEKGFTLIELIVIIVILGILAVTAIPRYVDMKSDAEHAAATGVYGAAQGAATMNFAATLLNKNTSADYVDNAATLFAAMDGTPDRWITDPDDPTRICSDADTDGACDATPVQYVIEVTTPESSTNKAGLTKVAGGSW